MKIGAVLGAVASVVAVLSYFGISPETATAENNIQKNSGDNSYQINAGGDVTIGTAANGTSPARLVCDGKFVLIKPGAYGAVNQEIYNHLQSYLQNQDVRKIDELQHNGLVVRFRGSTKACIKERQFHWYRVKVSVKGDDVGYWLPESEIVSND
jgi:hypothetical protein